MFASDISEGFSVDFSRESLQARHVHTATRIKYLTKLLTARDTL
jgi:hypothetical protein